MLCVLQVCEITEQACRTIRAVLEQRQNRASVLRFFIASLETRCIYGFTYRWCSIFHNQSWITVTLYVHVKGGHFTPAFTESCHSAVLSEWSGGGDVELSVWHTQTRCLRTAAAGIQDTGRRGHAGTRQHAEVQHVTSTQTQTLHC